MSAYYEFKLPTKNPLRGRGPGAHPHELEGLGQPPPPPQRPGAGAGGHRENRPGGLHQGGMDPAETFCRIPRLSIEVVNQVAALFRGKGCDSPSPEGGGSVIDTAKGGHGLWPRRAATCWTPPGARCCPGAHVPLCGHPHHRRHWQRGHSGGRSGRPGQPREDGVSQLPPAPGRGGAGPDDRGNPAPRITAATGFDALVHAIEAATCLQRNPVSDAFAEKAWPRSSGLPGRCRTGRTARPAWSWPTAACWLGRPSPTPWGAGPRHRPRPWACATWPTGEAMTILLPAVMKYNFEKCKERYGELLPLAGPEVYAATPAELRAQKTIDTGGPAAAAGRPHRPAHHPVPDRPGEARAV